MATDKIGRNQTFPIYNADGSSFQNLVLKKSVVDSVVMSLSDKITGDVYYKSNNLVVTMQEYIVYQGVKYLLVNPPTIVRNGIVSDNSELKGMTKYSFVFYHPMYQLSNLPFGDVAVTQSEERYLSENKVFSWIGYPNDFIAKLNSNLDGTQWMCERSSNFPSGKDTMLSSVLSFNNNTIADALKTWYDTWEIPYVIDQVKSSEQSYASGKRFKIVLGLPNNEIYEYSGDQPTQERYIFKMGKGLGLKNNSVTPKNNKIITRIAGYGSEDNVPYGYPQIVWTGSEDDSRLQYPLYKGIVGGQYVNLIKHPFTRTHLMPSVYVDRVNKKVNPNATGYDPTIQLVDYYDAIATEQYPYVNEINADAPSYEFHEFEEIKPELGEETLVGVTPIDKELQPVQDWDDTMDEDGNYTQSYFRVTLPQLSFDIYACAAITQEMQINMRSGACIGCTFPVMVDWESYKANFYDENGDFAPTGSQRDYTLFPDSSQGSINLILQKETTTFGTLMPNVYQNPHSGDQFVVLGISLPLSYITNAESRLDAEMKSYMLLNNIHYYEYPLKFDEYFLANRIEILQQIHPNSIIRFEYNGSILELYVKQLTIKFGESPLPQYDITLTDNIEVVSNPIGKVSENVDKLATLVAITQNNQKYGSGGSGSGGDGISRTHDDIAQGEITFLKGIKIGLLKLFGWDSKGNIKVNNTKVEGNLDVNGNAKFKKNVEIDGLLSSLKAKINELYSWNYSGSGIFESGWLLTNNHHGHSYLEVDELLVRMKAVFMELEIRKETYSGGNVFYSPAGSIIYRVEPQNASNEPLGQRTIEAVRPWSWGRRLLGLFGLSKIGLFSHKYVVKIQDEVDPLLVHHYRCYLIADDGTVQTRNWWHDNDQARCQTFNRASEKHNTDQSDQTNPNFDDNYVQRNMDGNRFFWRLVTNVGSTKLEDGKWYDYVDLDNFTPDDGYVRGSDVPVAGDSIVCIGNRVEEERMNMIMLEVIGDDAPAIKIYKGINSFSFDGRKYMNVSPKKIQLRSGSIEYISDNGQILPPKMSRGAWVSGVRYHYYDEVSHSGSTWLCIIIDGYRWEDAQGNIIENESLIGEIRAGEGLFVYGTDSHGEDLKDRYYSIGTYDGAPAYKVRKYTINEPSDLYAAEWQKEVSAGGSGVRGSFKSRVFARTNTNIATEYYTPTGGDYDYPWPGGENPHTYRGVTWHDGVPAGKEILWSSVCTFYGAGGSSEWSTPSPETDTSTLDIEFSPSLTKPLPPAVGANDTPPTTPTGTKITDPTGTHGSRANGSNDEADWYDTQKDANNTHADWPNARWRAERQISNGAYYGEWAITKIKGEDGDGIPGDFKSTAFIRTNVDISNVTPTGGTYAEPWPTSTDGGATWSDGIPNGEAMLWASNCTFYGDGSTSDWDSPRKMMDTQNYDVEFAFLQDPDEEPDIPDQYNRHGGSGTQIWYDPILDNPLPPGTQSTWSDMVWRAEKETINGVEGTWVITRIKGEKGEIDPSQIPQEWIDEVIDQASKALQEGLSIIISPQVIFVRQDTEGDVVFNNATADVEVFKSDVLQVFSIPSGQLVTDTIKAFGKTDAGYIEMQNCASAEAVSNDPSHPTANTLWRVKLTGIEKALNQQTGEYDYAYDNGYIRFKVNVTVVTDDTTTPPTTSTKSYWMKVAWYLNRLGNRIEKSVGDVLKVTMTRREYNVEETLNDEDINLLRGTKVITIGSGGVSTDTWSRGSDTYCTIETLTGNETPITGYNNAFKVQYTASLYKWGQEGAFWSSIGTYKFSAFAKASLADTTASISVAQTSMIFSKTVSLGTEWTYISFVFTIDEYDDENTGRVLLGAASSGTVYFVAPTVTEVTSPSVVRKDYEGQIETSSAGIKADFKKVTDVIGENAENAATREDLANYVQTSDYNAATIMQKIGGEVVSTSEFEQTASSLRMGVTNGWIKNYIDNPIATDGTKNGTVDDDDYSIVEDKDFGNVVQIYNAGENWQLTSHIDDTYNESTSKYSYEDLTGKTVTWYCIVKAVAQYSSGNFELHFGTGADETYANLHAIIMKATNGTPSGAPNPITVESGLNESYYEDISFGQEQLGVNGWYICWVTATPLYSSTTIIRGGNEYSCGFNSMKGTWQMYYGGVVKGSLVPSVEAIRENTGLERTGIDITRGLIRLTGGNVEIDQNLFVPTVLSENDDMYTQISAGRLEIRSKLSESYGLFEINNEGEIILSMFNKNGECVINIGGSPNSIVNGEWIVWKLYPRSTGHISDGKTYYAVSESQCTPYYQLKLGQVNNSGTTLQWFLPPVTGATKGEETQKQGVHDKNKWMFVESAYQSVRASASASSMENLIISKTLPNDFIPDGYYVLPNNGRYEVEANQYGPTNYKVNIYYFQNGSLQTTIVQRFSL